MPDGIPPCVSQAFFMGKSVLARHALMPAPVFAAQPPLGGGRIMKEAIDIAQVLTKPRTTFEELVVRPETLRAIHRLGWQQPTPIQMESIPVMAAGTDLVGQAETGSGKTGAYGIPIVERVDAGSRDLQALILVPTRELALQVAGDLRSLGRDRRLSVAALFGGRPLGGQITELRRGPQIAVATPGRLLDHLDRGTVKLGGIAIVILDEADRMLDMGFLPDVSRILGKTPPSRQTALFSATIPQEIRAIAAQYMRSPAWVRIAAPLPTVETVEQFYLEVAEVDRVKALRRLLRDESITSGLIFRRTRYRVDRLARALRDTRPGVLHGGLREGARLAALRAFEERRTRLLIATNVASRGLDLTSVSHVINFDMPEDVDTYIHRVGRTARAGQSGTAITFVSEYDIEMFDQLQRRFGPALRRHPLNIYA
jgi:ATP-dependent RNA helicase DeaD